MSLSKENRIVWFAILVSALGYFVDVFDIILFTVVRIPSLRDLGLPEDQITSTGIMLLNFQLVGMIVGGILWGILGDKRGRLSVLFGSIFLYSVTNLANAYVSSIPMYAVLRFLAGMGLAGELGAGITLVSELMGKHARGMGTMLVAVFGCAGGIVGGYMASHTEWRTMYIIGGSMGLVLLALRWKVGESPLFKKVATTNVVRGDVFFFFRSKSLLIRYLQCLGAGTPFWIFIGLVGTLAPEIAKDLNVESVSAAQAIMYLNIGVALGELSSSFVSQLLKSRRKAIAIYLTATMITLGAFFNSSGMSVQMFNMYYVLLGTCAGYWTVFLMCSVEQFGTNMRATASISLPNFVRGMVVPLSMILASIKPTLGISHALGLIIFSCILIAYFCVYSMKETFSTDLNFLEE